MRIPLVDISGLAGAARRAWLIRVVLAGGLATVLVGAFAAVPSGGARLGHRHGRTVVVLDISGSIETSDFVAVGRALTRAAREAGNDGAGLVLFSDTAEEALPPGTPITELLRFMRFFAPQHALSGQSEPSTPTTRWPPKPAINKRPVPASPINPWQPRFTGGTAISQGVAQARAAIGGAGRIIVISDFVDSAWDAGPLHSQLLAIARTPGLSLQAMPLPAMLPGAAAPYLALVQRTLPPAALGNGRDSTSPRSTFPSWLVLLGALLAAALAANEALAVSLRWREART